MVNNYIVLTAVHCLKFMDHNPQQTGIVANAVMPSIMSNCLGE